MAAATLPPPQTSPAVPHEPQETAIAPPVSCVLTVWTGAESVYLPHAKDERRVDRPRGGGVRARCTTFTDRARRTLRMRLGRLRRDAPGIAVRLSFPVPVDGTKAKAALSRFKKRMRRHLPSLSFVWRLEGTWVKTGRYAGCASAHFHLVAYSVDEHTLRAVIPWQWAEAVGMVSRDVVAHGCHVALVRNAAAYRWYLSKRDTTGAGAALGACGRRWGVHNADGLPTGVRVMVRLGYGAATRVLRWMRRCTGSGRVHGLVSEDPSAWLRAAKLARAGPRS